MKISMLKYVLNYQKSSTTIIKNTYVGYRRAYAGLNNLSHFQTVKSTHTFPRTDSNNAKITDAYITNKTLTE
jgi:hypothetical protein